MEAAAGGAGRPIKQWRPINDQQARNAGSEELERSKLGQSDERTIYEGQEALDAVDFCSIQMDDITGVDDGILQQKIHNLARQREELQQLEIELRAQMIAKSEIIEIQSSYDAQLKDQASVSARLQEQLREREQAMHELERKMEENERELHAAWAKEDMLREQSKELQNFRRERDSIEAERAHHIKQIHDLQEHLQDKDRQLLELQEQHRVAQESLLYKDREMRDVQAWLAQVQENALQSTTLQAELRERTEQYNQLWLGCQRQFAEMERQHMQAMQQLHLDLAGVGGKNGTYSAEQNASQNTSSDGSQIGPNNGNVVEANGGGSLNDSAGGLSNGNSENVQAFISSGNSSSQTNHLASLPFTAPSILGMPSYLTPGQVAAMHPYVMHQQGANHSLASHVPQSHVGHFHSVPAVASFQQWQNQQVASESPMSSQNQYQLSQTEENPPRSESNHNYEFSVYGPGLHPEYLNAQMSQGLDSEPRMTSIETLESAEKSYTVASEVQQSLQQISSQFHEALRLDNLNQIDEVKEDNSINIADNRAESQDVVTEQPGSAASPSPSDASVHQVQFAEAVVNSTADTVLSEAFVSTGQSSPLTGKVSEAALLDERALLTCIVRTIPAGGKIRISSTLPNRLGKMLAPLHWHDYKKKYGKLDDFVASHPELFVIEGDYIQLREGAQGIIAATAAVAKVAAAAAAPSPYSSFFPSVAVTPMAHAGTRTKKVPSLESKPARNSADDTHMSPMQSHHSNGAAFNFSGGLTNVKILSKSRDPLDLSGPEIRPGQPLLAPIENGNHHSDRSGMSNLQNKGTNYARAGASFVSKQQSRTPSAPLASRR